MKARAAGFALVILVASTLSCSKETSRPNTPLFNSGTFGSGQSYVRYFDTPGTFGYHCGIHGAMRASVTVTAGTGTADSAVVTIVDATSTGFQPGAVSIAANTASYVRWINQSGDHTVTSH